MTGNLGLSDFKKMHAKITSDNILEKDFSNALMLLHSTEGNSTERLRQMLDACIERTCGFGKTLAARVPKKLLQRVELHDESTSAPTRISRRCNCTQRRAIKSEIWNGSEAASPLKDNAAENNIADDHRTADACRRFETDDENCCKDEDVPRISIPDEGSVDGTVCKICNGAKLGPLILLECQDCQELYHPLCHQPPVVDVDVYDPRFVWRCRRCIETSSTIFSKITARKSADKARRTDDAIEKNGNALGLKQPEKRRSNFFRKNDSIENRGVQLRDSPLFAKDISLKRANLSSSMRKRIGSKLSVVRAPIK